MTQTFWHSKYRKSKVTQTKTDFEVKC